MCGVQSFALYLLSVGTIKYNGYLYIRIMKKAFWMNEDKEYEIIALKTSDSSVGAIIILQKNDERLQIDDLWYIDMKKRLEGEGNNKYRELWLPAFTIKCESNVKGHMKLMKDKCLNNIIERGRLEIFGAIPHAGQLEVDNTKDILIIDKDFLFGTLIKLTLGLIHEELDKILGIPLLFRTINKAQWV